MKMLRLVASLFIPAVLGAGGCPGGEMRECVKLCDQLNEGSDPFMECYDQKCVAHCEEVSSHRRLQAVRPMMDGPSGQCLATQVMDLHEKIEGFVQWQMDMNKWKMMIDDIQSHNGDPKCKMMTTCTDPADWPLLIMPKPGPPAPSRVGCSDLAQYKFQIGPKLWLCATNNDGGGTYQHVWEACNEAGQYHLASVGPITAMKDAGGVESVYTQSMVDAMIPQVSASGFDYSCSGQPTRGADWSGHSEGFKVGALGYVITNGNPLSFTNEFNELLDGNCDGLRSWHSANTPSAHTLTSICMDASRVPNAYVFQNHIWRTYGCGNGHNDRRLLDTDTAHTEELGWNEIPK